MRRVLLALLGLVAVTSAQAEALRITVIPIVDTLPVFLAVDAGLFAKRNLDVTLIPAANQTIVIGSLVSQSAEIGNSIAPSVLQAREAGIDTVIVANAATLPYPLPMHVGVLARTGSGIKSAADLVGRKIAVLGTNGYHMVLTKRWLEEKGVDPNKVEWAEVGFAQMGDVLRAGQVDAVVSIDPFYNRIIQSGVGYSFDNFVASVPDGALIDFYVAERSWANAHRDTLKRFVDAVAEAEALIKTNDAAARASLAKWTRQPADVIAHTSIPDFSMKLAGSQMKFWIDLMRHQGLISENYDPESFIFKP